MFDMLPIELEHTIYKWYFTLNIVPLLVIKSKPVVYSNNLLIQKHTIEEYLGTNDYTYISNFHWSDDRANGLNYKDINLRHTDLGYLKYT